MHLAAYVALDSCLFKVNSCSGTSLAAAFVFLPLKFVEFRVLSSKDTKSVSMKLCF